MAFESVYDLIYFHKSYAEASGMSCQKTVDLCFVTALHRFCGAFCTFDYTCATEVMF